MKILPKKIALGLLTMLGFSTACSNVGNDDGGMVMYGTPHATFSAKITVKNEKNEPLSGIEVVAKEGNLPITSRFDVVDGVANTSGQVFPADKQTITFYAVDVDGSTNGLYATDSVKVDIFSSEFIKNEDKSFWNSGHVEKEATIVMKKVTKE